MGLSHVVCFASQDTWGQPLNVVQMGFSDLSDFLRAAGDFVVVERAEKAGRARGHKIIRLRPGVEGRHAEESEQESTISLNLNSIVLI